MSAKNTIADFLFAIQILGAFVFCGAYALRLIHDITGFSLAQFGLAISYLVFHLALAFGAHRADPSRGTRQIISTYIVWFVLGACVLVAAGTNPAYRWNTKDTTTLVTAAALTIVVLLMSAARRLPLNDPMVEASFAIAYKSVPQTLLAWKFLAEGGSGLPGLAVVVGHITILIRLGQIYFIVKKAGWDRNRVWLAVSETANELSWVIATIAWLLV